MSNGDMITLDANHGPDGKFTVGNTVNLGRDSHLKGLKPYSKHLQKFLLMPFEEFAALMRSPSKVKKMCNMDIIAFVHVRNMMKGKVGDIGDERERMLNRLEGKVKDTLVIETINAHRLIAVGAKLTTAEASQKYQEALKMQLPPREDPEDFDDVAS